MSNLVDVIQKFRIAHGFPLAPTTDAERLAETKASEPPKVAIAETKVGEINTGAVKETKKAETMREIIERAMTAKPELWSLSSLEWRHTGWDGSIPLIDSQGRPGAMCGQIEFRKRFAIAAPHLAGFDMRNIVVADQAVCDIMYNRPVSKIQMFLVGVNHHLAIKKIDELTEHLSKFYEGEPLRFFRNSDRIVFQRPLKKTLPSIQVNLKLYDCVQTLLNSFDLGSAAGAFDGDFVSFSTLGKLAHEYGVNVLDLSRRHPEYESRICEYHRAGFGLVVPDLDVEKGGPTRLGFIHFRTVPRVGAGGEFVARYMHENVLPSPKVIMLTRMLKDNLKATNQFPVKTEDLAVNGRYVPGTSVLDAQVSFEGLEKWLRAFATPRRIKAKVLTDLLGKEVTAKLAWGVIMDEKFDYAAFATDLIAVLVERAVIPVDIPIATSMFKHIPTTPIAWYGSYLKGRAA